MGVRAAFHKKDHTCSKNLTLRVDLRQCLFLNFHVALFLPKVPNLLNDQRLAKPFTIPRSRRQSH